MRFVPDCRFGKKLCDGSRDIYSIVSDKRDNIWFSGLFNKKNRFGFITDWEQGEPKWHFRPLLIIPQMMVLSLTTTNDGAVWIGGAEGLFRYDNNVDVRFKTPLPVAFTRVTVGEESLKKPIYGGKDNQVLEIPYRDNVISFYYSFSNYSKKEGNLYSYILEGYEKKWSSWTRMTQKRYMNLDEGDYTFRVKAKNIFDLVAPETTYRFRVLTPWYRTIVAYLAYGLGLIVFIYILLRLNSMRLVAAKKRLEAIVAARTEQVVKQKEVIAQQKEEAEAHALELSAMNKELIQTKNALWGEMELAKKIQTVLLPQKPSIAGYDIASYMKPADEVGGDYYDVINVAGKEWVVIGDVSGHGVPAGLVMMMVQTAIHTVLEEHADSDPRRILEIVNRVIYRNIDKLHEDKYMTLTVLSYHDNGVFYFSGLHQDILVYRSRENRIDSLETQGMWVGVLDEIGEILEVDHLQLEHGDAMLLFTDGITEARLDDGTMFENEQLRRIFKTLGNQTAGNIKNGILKALSQYTCHDDVTLIVIKRR